MGDEFDERLEFVFRQVQSTFKNINPDKFEAFSNHEENLVSDFPVPGPRNSPLNLHMGRAVSTAPLP